MHDFHYRDMDFFLFHLKEDIPIPEEFIPHAHPQRAELLCFISGKCKYSTEDASLSLHPGDLILIAPNEIHHIEVDPTVPYERICITFRPEAFTALDKSGIFSKLLNDRTVGKKKLFRTSDLNGSVCVERFYDMMEPSPDRHLTILANMLIILQKISMVYESLSENSEQAVTLEQQLVHYINQNLEKELTTEALCRQFFLSRAQLFRFFRTTIGTSVGKFITAKRMVKAQNLILQGQKPTEVFPQCGYQNYSSFFRAYCRFFGHSPKEDARTGAAGVPYSSIKIG